MSEAGPVQAVARSLRLLNAIAADGEVGVIELAQATGLSAGTTHRLLATLVAGGYVEHDPQTRRYRLGIQLFTVAAAGERQLGRLRRAAAPALERLRDAFDETTNLVVLDRASIVYVDQVESTRPVRLFSRIGNRVPAHASGAGKALLAHAAAEDVEALLAGPPLQAVTEHTITAADALRAELVRVRERGWALDEEEFDEGVVCAAAPVLVGGRALAAVSVSGPSERMRRRALDAVGARVAQAAGEVAAALA